MSAIIGGEQMSQFYCCEEELRKLNKRYAGDAFACIVIYGRRRVGKTALINEFCKPTILFCCSFKAITDEWSSRDMHKSITPPCADLPDSI